MSSPILRCRLRQLYQIIRGCQKKKPAAGRPKPQFWLEELESRLAPASYAVNAQLAVSSFGQLGNAPYETHAVVFFESSVANFEVLEEGLGAGTDAVVLDSGGDGLREMAAFLAGRHGLTSIGVVAHGAPGMVALGTATLDAHSLTGYTRELAVLGSALGRAGELDLWSCDVAAGPEGASLVQDLGATTGAGIAAADHVVGSAALGGTWQLDVRVAGATGDVPFSAAAMGAFHRLLAVTIVPSNNTAKGYVGLDFNQSNDGIPPDSNGAAGPNSYVETVNQTIAIYTPKATGATRVSLGLDSFFATLAPVDSTAFFSDPVVVYDDNMPGLTPTTGRFIVGDENVSSLASGASVFDIAVSKSANPGTLTSAEWTFYRLNTTENGFGADFPGNFGYNNDAFVFTLNQFGIIGPPDHVEVFSVSAADLAVSAPTLHSFHNDVLNDISLRPTTMHDAVAGDPMWLLSETGDDLNINVYKMTNVLSFAATFTMTQVAVNPYTDMSAALPKQPNGSVITSVIDSAIQKVSEANNTLVADHSVSLSSTEDAAQWYVIDVSSGTPVLQQQGDVSIGNNTYASFPSIDINELGNIGMTFMESGTAAGHFMSMYITGRTPADPMGTMETPVPVPAGTGIRNYSNGPGGRAGDISGINVDPVDGSFWVINEFANSDATANWGTAIANFTLADPADPSKSTIAVVPATIPLGGTATVTLTAKDAAGIQESQGGLPFSFGLGTGTSSGTFSNLTDNNDGTYTATFTGTSVGPVTITATLNGQAITSTLPTITVVTTTTTQLVISNLSSTSITAGNTVTFTVTAEGSSNNPIPNYTGTVQLTSTDSNAAYGGNALPATYTFVAGDNGSHSFTVTLQTAGTKTITVTDQANSSLTATTSPITVATGPFSKFAFAVVGGNTVVAGNSFNLTAQATDQFGNSVGGANVPTTIMATANPSDAHFPITAQVSASGFAFFLANLQMVGSYTLTAWSATANVIVTPASAAYFTISAPAAATTGGGFNVTVKAFDRFGNLATGYTGTVNITSTDLAASILVPSYTFAPGDQGVHTFTNITLKSSTLGRAGTTIVVRDTTATTPPITGFSAPITVQGLVVIGNPQPTATGFTVTFSKPFTPADLTLYGLNKTTVPDVSLVGANPLNGNIPGTLFVDPANPSQITFKATNAFLEALNLSNGNADNGDKDSVALPDDTYTVTLVSGTGSNGFVDALNSHLDGLANGTAANYTATFTTTFQDDANNNANPAQVLSIPDFARGPDSSTTVTVPNNKSALGIPITLYNAAGVQDTTFTLTYNPQIFTPSAGGTVDAPAGSTFTMGTITSVDSTHSAVGFTYHNATAHSGTVILGDILATVPNSAAGIYKTKELLALSGITVTGGATVQAADGIHVDAYLGDVHVTALPAIDASDALDAQKVASGAATGFAAYGLLDPAIIGNVGQNLSVDSAAVTNLFSKAVHLAVPRIPSIPAAVTAVSVSGADPTVSLAGAAQANGIVSVAVLLDQPHPDGSTGMTEAHLALTYDPSVLTVSPSDITLGSIPGLGAGWQITSEIDAATGQIGINVFNLNGTPITSTQAVSLVNIDFHVAPGAAVLATSVQLVSRVTPNGQRIVTEVDDDQGPLTLSFGVDRLFGLPGVMSKAHYRHT